jgi:prepilin-type processing-associated H-X9-DG protein
VVIGIIGVLAAMLLPTLANARKSAQATQCGSNLRQIGMAVRFYLQESKGWFPQHPNGGLWENPPGRVLLNYRGGAVNDEAYWGVCYVPYLLARTSDYESAAGGGGNTTVALSKARSMWQCPSAKITDVDPGYSENHIVTLTATYGLNDLLSRRKADRMKKHAELIVCHDAWEHKLEGNAGGDWLMAYSVILNHPTLGIVLKKESGNLLQYESAPYAKLMRDEYYRHFKKSQVLWLDGHVEPVPLSNGTNLPFQWYAGDGAIVR